MEIKIIKLRESEGYVNYGYYSKRKTSDRESK